MAIVFKKGLQESLRLKSLKSVLDPEKAHLFFDGGSLEPVGVMHFDMAH